MALRSIELFAGGGGLALGLEACGVVPVCFVEREAFAVAVLAKQMEAGRLAAAPVWSDITTFDGSPWRGVVQVVSGGFPCQDISSAGKGAGIVHGQRSGLWGHFARVINEVDPSYVFIENVGALVRRGLDVVLADLATLGFDAEWGCFRASDAGAPHRRERVFILAYSRSERGQLPAAGEHAAIERASGHGHTGLADAIGCRYGRVAANAVGPEEQRAASERDGAGVGNATGGDGEVSSVIVRPAQERQSRGAGRDDVVAGWPPGPSDDEGWAAYLRRNPGTEPALRRGADGMAHRVDRLRCLGNGVVPQQAELAWRELMRRITQSNPKEAP